MLSPAPDPILDRIVAEDRPAIEDRILVALAHPDDETLACGALLPRLRRLAMLHVTDGAPRDGRDAARHGFASPADYAAARRRELAAALAAGGIAGATLACLDLPDQGAALELAETARRLTSWLAGADVVITHALEGGHPDHDATAFAVRAAAALLPPGASRPTILEVPLYNAGDGTGGWNRQRFANAAPGAPARTLRLTAEERTRKAAMLARHATQAATLAGFGVADEPYRAAAPADLAAPANGGRILYDREGWGVTGQRFAELARSALASLGLDGPG